MDLEDTPRSKADEDYRRAVEAGFIVPVAYNSAAQDGGEWLKCTPLEPRAPRAPGPVDLNNQGRSWDVPRRAPEPEPAPEPPVQYERNPYGAVLDTILGLKPGVQHPYHAHIGLGNGFPYSPHPSKRGLSSEEVQAESAKAAAAAVRSAYRVFKDHGAFMYQSRGVWVLRSDIERAINTCYDGPIPVEDCAEYLLKEICTQAYPYMDDGDGRRYCQLTVKGLDLLRAEYDRGC